MTKTTAIFSTPAGHVVLFPTDYNQMGVSSTFTALLTHEERDFLLSIANDTGFFAPFMHLRVVETESACHSEFTYECFINALNVVDYAVDSRGASMCEVRLSTPPEHTQILGNLTVPQALAEIERQRTLSALLALMC